MKQKNSNRNLSLDSGGGRHRSNWWHWSSIQLPLHWNARKNLRVTTTEPPFFIPFGSNLTLTFQYESGASVTCNTPFIFRKLVYHTTNLQCVLHSSTYCRNCRCNMVEGENNLCACSIITNHSLIPSFGWHKSSSWPASIVVVTNNGDYLFHCFVHGNSELVLSSSSTVDVDVTSSVDDAA